MIPVGDVIPWRRPPLVTVALIAVSAGFYACQLSLDEPRRLALVRATATIPDAVRPLSLLTSAFLHASPVSLVANLGCLWIFGSSVEDRVGRARYVVFYLLCGLANATAHVLANAASHLPMLSGAGAVAGVLGGYFVLFPRSRVLVLVPLVPAVRITEVPATYLLAGWFSLQLVEAALIPGGPVARAALLLGLAVAFGVGAAAVVALGGLRRRSLYWQGQ